MLFGCVWLAAMAADTLIGGGLGFDWDDATPRDATGAAQASTGADCAHISLQDQQTWMVDGKGHFQFHVVVNSWCESMQRPPARRALPPRLPWQPPACARVSGDRTST
jgi:hypothetical protein